MRLLHHGFAARFDYAIAMPRAGTGSAGPLDGYLAGLAAYTTILGLSGPSRWRTSLWLAVVVYCHREPRDANATVLSLPLALLLGRAIGLGVRYAAGSWSQRPPAHEIAAALDSAGDPVTAMRRSTQNGIESRLYAATASRRRPPRRAGVRPRPGGGGGAVPGLALDPAAGAGPSWHRPLSLERAVERRALLSYAADEAGVRTPRLRALIGSAPTRPRSPTTIAKAPPAELTLTRPIPAPAGRFRDLVDSGPTEPSPAVRGQRTRPGRFRPRPGRFGPHPGRSGPAGTIGAQPG